jgi:acetoacetate decarboxylase
MAFTYQVPRQSWRTDDAGEPTFTSARLLTAAYLSDPGSVSASLPKGFEPGDQPLVVTFVAEYPQTNFGSFYHEAAILVSCKFRGEGGSLCLGMVVDDDVALILGREVFGYPKKLASIELRIELNKAHASVTRRGVQFLEIDAELSSPIENPQMPALGPTFLVKAFPAADLTGFEWKPKVVKSSLSSKVRTFRPASKIDLALRESELDRWAAFPVKEVLFGGLLEADMTMAPGVIAGELDETAWLPFALANVR